MVQIFDNCYVNSLGAWDSSGVLIEGTTRISKNNREKYWQQANHEIKVSLNFKDIRVSKRITKAFYLGWLPQHYGHFIMETLPRCRDWIDYNIPGIGDTGLGLLPERAMKTPKESSEWLLRAMSKNHLIGIKQYINESYIFVKKLYVGINPYNLSTNCPAPWRMSKIIEKIVNAARAENPSENEKERLYLKRHDESLDEISEKKFQIDEIVLPEMSISRQIAKISKARSLYGKAGSNAHACIWARADTELNFTDDRNYVDCRRNQAICQLVKTYNTIS